LADVETAVILEVYIVIWRRYNRFGPYPGEEQPPLALSCPYLCWRWTTCLVPLASSWNV